MRPASSLSSPGWGVALGGALCTTLIEIPISAVYGLQAGALVILLDLVVSGLLFTDLAPRFRELWRAPPRLTPAGQRVRMMRWLALTGAAVAALPLALFGVSPLIRLIRCFTVLRLIQITRGIVRWGIRSTRVTPAFSRLLGFGSWTLLASHWLACGWLALGGGPEGLPPAQRYLMAIYYTFTTLGTVGYGDIVPKTPAQTLYSIVVMVIGTAIYGYIVGSIASLIANLDLAKAHHDEKMEQIAAFLEYRRISPNLRERILNYYEYLWESRMGFDERAILAELPPSLKTELSLFVNRGLIEKVPLFRDAGEEFVRDTVLALRPQVVPPGELIIRRGEVGDEMYFISRGIVEIVAEDEETVYATLTEGQFFGEIALVTKEPRTATARSAAYCDLYTLDRSHFERVLSRYPEVAETIHSLARQRQTDKLTRDDERRTRSFERHDDDPDDDPDEDPHEAPTEDP